MAPTLEELAEDTLAFLPAMSRDGPVDRGGLLYLPGSIHATVVRIRSTEDLGWARAETRRRDLDFTEWWVGWSAPDGVAAELLAAGLVPDEVPVLTGMTCETAPPVAPDMHVTPIETLEDLLATLDAVDWTVWQIGEEERAKRRAVNADRFDEERGIVHHWCARDGDRRVGFGRAVDVDGAVVLLGGAVLPDARGRGVYRALVRARWDHAVARGTPLLVVQAGELSAPVLDGLGFRRHGDVRLFVDRL